jgi:hypothetical protein
MTETVDQAQAQPPRALAGIIEDARVLGRPVDHRRGVPRDAYRIRGTRQGCRAGILPGQRSALMPKCSMNHACGPSTSQAITAPSCVTPTATASKPFAAPPDSDRRRVRRHLPLPTTVRLLQARAEPERGWLLQRR